MHRAWDSDSSLKQGRVCLYSQRHTWQASLFLNLLGYKANLHFPSLLCNITDSPYQKTHIKSNVHLHHMFARKCLWSWVAWVCNHLDVPPVVLPFVCQFPFWNLGSNPNTLYPPRFADWGAEHSHHFLVSDTISVSITWDYTRFLWPTSHNQFIWNCS